MQADETPKYCRDCRFCQIGENGLAFAKCAAPQSPPGIESDRRFLGPEFPQSYPPFATVMRGGDHRCGPAAKWFQPKQDAAVAA